MTTSKTVKSISLLTAITLITMLVVTEFDGVDAQKNDKQKKGKNEIKQYKDQVESKDNKRMKEIQKKLQDGKVSKSEKMKLNKEAKDIQDKSEKEGPKITAKKLAKLQKLEDKLIEALETDKEFRNSFNSELVGFGIDEETQTIFFDVEPEFATNSKAAKHFEKIRKILGTDGDDEDIHIKPMKRAIHSACATVQSDCTPLVGGIQIEADWHGKCTFGFQAKKVSTGSEGFITAGHCGDMWDDVHQPLDLFNFYEIGTVRANAYDSSTYCDCAYVDITVSTNAVEDEIFPHLDAVGIGTISYNLFVTMTGAQSSNSGQIKTTSYTTLIDGTMLKKHFRVNFLNIPGDSGAPVYQTGDSTPYLYGFVAAQQSVYTIVSAAKYVDNELPGYVLDFN